MRALAADRKTFALTQAAIAAEVHESLDVHRHFAAQVAFDHVLTVDQFANLQNLRVGQLRHPPFHRQVEAGHDVIGDLLADAMDILQRDNDALAGRKIDARDTSHDCSLLLKPVAGRPRRSRRFPVVLEGDTTKQYTTPGPAALGPGIAPNSW